LQLDTVERETLVYSNTDWQLAGKFGAQRIFITITIVIIIIITELNYCLILGLGGGGTLKAFVNKRLAEQLIYP
jgi:hypothetical protein